jgi:hypothetical protein
MRTFTAVLGRTFVLACACVLLASTLAHASEPGLVVDLDGDGVHDRAIVDSREPSLLRVWLSSTDSISTIRNSSPLVGVVAIDLDGDHRAELIARDSAAGLHVWTRGRQGFHRVRPHSTDGTTLARQKRHVADDGATDESTGTSWDGASFLALALTSQPRAPASPALDLALDSKWSRRSHLPLDPFAPRPPPHTSL